MDEVLKERFERFARWLFEDGGEAESRSCLKQTHRVTSVYVNAKVNERGGGVGGGCERARQHSPLAAASPPGG